MLKLFNAGRLAGLILLAGVFALPFVLSPAPTVAYVTAPMDPSGTSGKSTTKKVTKTDDSKTTSTKKTKKSKKKKKDNKSSITNGLTGK